MRERGSTRAWPVLALAAAVVAAVTAAPADTAAPYTVVTADRRQTLSCVRLHDREMVPLDELATIFDLVAREDRATGGLTVGRSGRFAALTPGQSLASVGGRLVSLPAPVTRDGRRWLVPVEFVARAIALLIDAPIELRRDSRLVVVGRLRVPHVAVQVDASATESRIAFEISPAATHRVTREDGRLIVRFESDYLDLVLPPVTASGLVSAVRLVDPAHTVAIDLGSDAASYRASTSPSEGAPGATRLEVVVESASLRLPAAPPAAAPLPSLPATAPPPGLRIVALDPGHGGEEQGARGATGTLEKDLTLAVARRLKAALEARLGVRVVLTREQDDTVSLDDRAALANNHHADVLISLHANSAPSRDVRGFEVYYLATDRAVDASRAPAGPPPVQVPAYGVGRREIAVLLWELAQTRHLAQSATLAALIEEEAGARVERSARPVQQAPFRVLVGANMPAVLVEMGYLTSPDDERRLLSGEYQAAIVETLVDALARFGAELERAR